MQYQKGLLSLIVGAICFLVYGYQMLKRRRIEKADKPDFQELTRQMEKGDRDAALETLGRIKGRRG